jgi:hypothetical protein
VSWARELIVALARGQSVVAHPRGHSMTGRVADGQRVRIAPLHAESNLAIDDVVLCHVAGRDYLHLVKAIREGPDGSRYLIGNNRGGINGWVRRAAIFGRMLGDDGEPG